MQDGNQRFITCLQCSELMLISRDNWFTSLYLHLIMRMLHGSIFSLTRAQVWIPCSYFITMALEDTTACLFLACFMVGQ